MSAKLATLAEALAKLPAQDGRWSTFIVNTPAIWLKAGAPRVKDTQTPHTRDEIYIVAAGTSDFIYDGEREQVAPGDVLYAAPGVAHHFENFSSDFALWIVFYGPPVLHTERLTLRVLTGDDFESYFRIQNDDETMRYLNGQAMTREEAYRHMSYLLGQWQMRGYGYWGVVENETNELVGRVGFHNPDGWPGFELGWTILRDRWGRGYATEAARRALRYAFEELGEKHVISLIHPDNAASIAVAKKIGETLEGETVLFGTKPALIYGISAASPA